MGSPGIPLRLKKVASAVGRGAATADESAYPPLIAQMSGEPANPQRGQSDSAGDGSGSRGLPAESGQAAAGSDTGDSGPGTPESPATAPDEPPAQAASAPAKTLHDRRRAGRPKRGRPRSAHADRVILV